MILITVLWYGCHLIEAGIMKPDILISYVLYQFALADCLSSMSTVYSGKFSFRGEVYK